MKTTLGEINNRLDDTGIDKIETEKQNRRSVKLRSGSLKR